MLPPGASFAKASGRANRYGVPQPGRSGHSIWAFSTDVPRRPSLAGPRIIRQSHQEKAVRLERRDGMGYCPSCSHVARMRTGRFRLTWVPNPPYQGHPMPIFAIHAQPLHCRDVGEGVPILFGHGYPVMLLISYLQTNQASNFNFGKVWWTLSPSPRSRAFSLKVCKHQ